ncbi:hypothetical protein [Paramicrobacterium agarici]|uniref:hypothetical protein n=1 Tax=Paramicrobacterium agarici TaxID=630514 RepID=UPI001151EB91|nr:hypothetical protein [Microbacterium agarici]TQO23328.1 hypothetical protein FB385_2178 [Microbacterium agarici]
MDDDDKRLTGSARGWDIGISVTVLCLGAVVLVITFLVALFGIMMVSACSSECSAGLFVGGWLIAMILPFALLVAGTIWAIVFMVRARRALVIAIATIVVALAVWAGGISMMIGAIPGFTW